MPSMTMNRREAIVKMALLMGGTMVGPRLLHGAWDADAPMPAGGVEPENPGLLDEIGDTIIPATDVPGAKAVGIGAFVTMMVRDCYEEPDQAAFRAGVRELAESYRAKHGRAFVGAPAAERTEFLNALDREQREYTRKRKAGEPAHYFRILKELTVLGYFSSEIGATQALRFVEVPGSFDGSAPYKKGDHAWATS
jgi:hypothetical protein